MEKESFNCKRNPQNSFVFNKVWVIYFGEKQYPPEASNQASKSNVPK
jgi:hypothetical protein